MINNTRLKNYDALGIVTIMALLAGYTYFVNYLGSNGHTIAYFTGEDKIKESEGDLWHGHKIGKWIDYHYDGSPKYEDEIEEEYVLRSVEEGQTSYWNEEGRL